jgi:acyl-CoA dehydrogenase family member 9
MEKTQNGFLERLYAGAFLPALAMPSAPPANERTVKEYIDRFHEALAGYDVADLDAVHEVPAALLAKMREIGTFGTIIPRAYGGLGMTLQEYLRVIEELAASDMSLALIPIAHTSIGMKGILLFGTEEQKRTWLPRAASGETIFAYALTEPDTGSDAQHVRTTARSRDDGTWVLDGTKTYITNANYAGAFTVFAQVGAPEEGRMAAFIVERGVEGLSVGADMAKMGLNVSSTAMVRMRDVHVPAASMLGAPGDGFRIAMTILNYGRLALGAASAGLMKQSLRDMSRRASTRKQFGSAIREFELIQEKLVQARVHAFASQAMTFFTASLLENDPVMNVGMESSHCKLYGTTRCWDTLYDAQQTAGGAGYISTTPFGKRLRDFRVTTIFEGTTEIHSIYPPLNVARAYGKELASRTGPGKLAVLGRLARTRVLKRMKEKNPVLREAVRAAARSEELFRGLLSRGLRRYGKGLASQEFLLRRMTRLSMSLFWLVASVWFVKRRTPQGVYPAEDLEIVSYLIEEAREVQASNGKMDGYRKEEINGRIAKGLQLSEPGSVPEPRTAKEPSRA